VRASIGGGQAFALQTDVTSVAVLVAGLVEHSLLFDQHRRGIGPMPPTHAVRQRAWDRESILPGSVVSSPACSNRLKTTGTRS